MFTSYFKTALRHFKRQKSYSIINLAGLSVGLACSFLILLWVRDEINFDRFHTKGDQIYRVMRNFPSNDKIYTWSSVPMPVAGVLDQDIPEITHTILMTGNREVLFTREGDTYQENGQWASSAFFEVFTFPFLLGDAETALDNPDGLVISEDLAVKYFGADWQNQALGQTLMIDHRKAFSVTGVFENVPDNSTLQFDFILPMVDHVNRNQYLERWGNSSLRLYVKLREDAMPGEVNPKIENVIKANYEQGRGTLFLHPYTDLHLYSSFEEGKLVGGRIDYVELFVIVAFFILLIASINFMNLATARSSQRAREIGVRKAIGASQRTLIGQFMGESVSMALLAAVLAAGVSILLLPAFNELTGKNITLDHLSPSVLLAFFSVALLTGLASGSYPAFYLAAFNPVRVLRGTFKHGAGTGRLRQGLVVLQFTLAILLIIGTMMVYQQISFIRNKNLGLDRDNLIYMTLQGDLKNQYSAFRQELLNQPGIEHVTSTSQNPLSVGNSTTDPSWEGKDQEAEMLFHIINANFDYVETMKMQVMSGRPFSSMFATDSLNYLINQQMARVMAMDDPVGQRLKFWGREGEIVGVVEDFHFSSLHTAIEPLIIRMDPVNTWILYVRIAKGQTSEAIAGLEAVHNRFNPGYPFEYRFLDEHFEEMYRNEVVMGKLANYFALLAIFISCLGLFGLASFTAELRTKEIGVRKVLGASLPNLILLLTRDYIKLVALAFILATPVAYYLLSGWLGDFAYRIDLGYSIFILSGLLSCLIAFLTVTYQSLRAALANPVKTLRYE